MKRSPPILKEKARIVDSSLVPKLSSGLALLIIFLSATQLGFHFWPESAFVLGLRVDYLSPTIYLLDLLILSYLLTRSSDLCKAKIGTYLSSIPPLLLVNLIFSANPLATLSWSLHLLLYLAFVMSLFPQFRTLRGSRQVFGTFATPAILFALVISMFLQISLGFAQVLRGSSLQGPLYWFGERAVSVGTPNVAKAEVLGQIVLRAYGTFSHPNALAGWLVIALLIVTHLAAKGSFPREVRVRPSHVIVFATILASLGVLLTQSRAAALALFGIVIPFYLLRLKLRLPYYLITLLLCLLLYTPLLARSDLSVSERLSLQEVSLSVIRAYPLFGTGANATITTYPALAPNSRLLQPDHNTFTLFLSWFGLASILALLYYLKIGNWKLQILSPYLPLLPLLLLDHYLLTSPQGLFILLLYFRVVPSSKMRVQP